MPLNVSLLDTLHFDGWEGGRDLVDECTVETPTISGFDKYNNREVPISADNIDTDTLKTLVRTQLPNVDPFRYANEGVGSAKGHYEKRLIELATATYYWHCDKSIIDKYPACGGKYMRLEAEGVLKANLLAMERQFFYGNTDPDAQFSYEKGFQGLANFCSDEMTIDAGGTGPHLTTAWFVWWNPAGVQWIYGTKGSIQLSEPELIDVRDPRNSGRQLPAYQQRMEFYPGVSIQSRWAVGRITNIDVSSTLIKNSRPPKEIKNDLISDLTMRQMINLFPIGSAPNVIYMQPAVNLLLAASRSTVMLSNRQGGHTLHGMATPPVPDFEGIPICYTKNIKIGEKRYVRKSVDGEAEDDIDGAEDGDGTEG